MSIERSKLKAGRRLFASDNAAGIHPAVMAAIEAANRGHAVAYGNDPWTVRAVQLLREHFAETADVAFTFGGTGANIIGLSTVMQRYHSVVCAESSHLWRDECAAPERWIGGKLLTLPTSDGKIRPAQIDPMLQARGIVHRAQPRVVSVSQPTEWGTVYTVDELRALGEFCRANELLLHVDGARLANAAASLGVPLRSTSVDCGVDVLSFGGTKNGLLAGEAVLLFENATAEGLRFHHKQCGQLVSKMRFIAAQFEALLTDELWLKNARHANLMAECLANSVDGLAGIEIAQPVESNVVFLRVPGERAQALQERFGVAVWQAEGPALRVMTSFDSTEEDIDQFVALLKEPGP
ncbi:MAG: threonine aldolase family protein [Acidiferrobacterales bacterium]